MRKSYKLQDLECANCAAKIENAIKGIEGVNDASVSFMTQKLSLDVADDQLERVMTEVEQAIHKYEPDTMLVR